jgi:hypothetical protein
MERLTGPPGTIVSHDRDGSGPLVLVRGGFGDHITNGQKVRPLRQVPPTWNAPSRNRPGVMGTVGP